MDPQMQPLWVEYNKSIPRGDRPNRLTEGVSLQENEVVDKLMTAIGDVVAVNVTNLLKRDYPVLEAVHPELGVFEDLSKTEGSLFFIVAG